MVTCPACGYESPDGARFCAMCGERLSPVETTTTMPALEDQTLTGELSPQDLADLDALPVGSALLMVQKGPASGARFLLRDERVIAGRNPKSDIFLDDITVSRSHASFTRQDGSFLVQDLGSLNGTYVNKALLRQPTLLRNGDQVQIGKFRMIFFLGTAGTD